MQRQAALVLSIILFIIFTILTYYGAQVKLWSSIVFATFASIILLNLFYPLSQSTQDTADYTLVIYAVYQILAIFILFIYILQTSLSDVRN